MTKNIHVVDAQGNELTSTYPKRAKGLIKKGRARFISENTICLAGLPDDKWEATDMTDQPANVTVEYSISFILQQIVLLQADTAYLHETISSLAKMPDGDSGVCGSPGNMMGAEKAEAFCRIVESRETTNQRLLQLYEKMYDDLSKRE